MSQSSKQFEKRGYKNKNGYRNRKYINNNIKDIEDYFKMAENPKKDINYNFLNRKDKESFNKLSEKPKKEKSEKKFISFYELNEIIKKDDNEIINFFMKYDLPEIFKSTKFSKDMIYLMTELLAKISFINSGASSIILKQIIENTSFIQLNIKNELASINLNDIKYLNFLLNVAKFSDKLLDKNSESYKRIKPGDLLEVEELLQYEMEKNDIDKKDSNTELVKQIIAKINEFKEREKHRNILKYKEMKEKGKEDKKDIKNAEKIPIDYKSSELLLKREDFNSKRVNLIAPHIKSGSYFSFERYINTMFYLEKEDCYRSLREAIYILQSNAKSINDMTYQEIKNTTKKFSDLYFYINGTINYIDVNCYGIIITLDFLSANSRKIKFTKRMITGSLVVLTDNNYTDYLLTTVFYNPYFDKKENENENRKSKIKLPKEPYYRVQLSLVNINAQSFLFLLQNREKLQIFESKAYFESYIHIMKRLQKINVKDLPFKSELIDGNFDNIKMKQPVDGYQYKDLRIYPDKKEFPNEFKMLLDESQLKAAEITLNNKISIVQGPPGTGKTHFGTIITNIFLQNLNNNYLYENEEEDESDEENINKNSQILVVCYTNHALDQFIEKISNYTNNIVRIGGRCKNEKVKKFELHNKVGSRAYYNIMNKINIIGEEMKKITSLIDIRRRVSASIVEREFNDLYTKVIDDFLYLVKKSISTKYHNKLKINRSLERKIYCFWNMIGVDNNEPDEIICLLLDELKLSEEKYNYLFIKIKNGLNGYNYDNLDIIRYINNNNENENNIILENEDENINNINGQYYEEEEESYDEDEIAENEDKLKYRGDEIQNIDDYFNFYQNKDREEEEEEGINLLDENDIDLRKLTPLTEEKYNNLINSNNNFFRLGPKIIKLFIDYMKNKLLVEEMGNVINFDEFNDLLNRKNEISLINEAEAIKNTKIVAMTTTGCAKFSTILEQRNFEIIIIEEAAEVLESHVVSLLTKNTKRLILIGDHKQLKPKPYNYEIGAKYNFDISLFERLINNKIPYASLKYQRRMKPKFADFVRIIYGGEEYIDYKDCINKENVKGIVEDMYFINHYEPEAENIHLKSKQNDYEARYLSKLCNYLILQNYNSENIVILTLYTGQVLLIRKYLKQYNLRNIRVTSVDNYQGEESDIILLSLVRSNKDYEIGFLRTFNRVCVAFSRAKIGFYIIGNFNCILRGEEKIDEKLKKLKNIKIDEKMSGIWAKIIKKAEELKIIGNKLVLDCQNHKKQTIISKIEDFDNCPEGGCQEPCKKRMKCGHACEKLCHIYDCNSINCIKPCTKKYYPCEHPCKKLCYEDCGECKEKVEKALPCGHLKKDCICSEKNIKCFEKCEKKLKCGHFCKLKCYQECDSSPCKEEIEKALPCGHKIKTECGKKLYEIVCEEKCEANLECGHKCKGSCGKCLQGTLHAKCESKCGTILPCGHPCQQKCSAVCICEKDCENVCPHGYCGDQCCDICVACEEKCEIGCRHRKCYLKCGEICKRIPCEERCEKKMQCGHQCYGLCGEKCPEICRKCNPKLECFTEDFFYKCELDEEALIYKTDCGHIFRLKDWIIISKPKIERIKCFYALNVEKF